jgi:hypothetical protein
LPADRVDEDALQRLLARLVARIAARAIPIIRAERISHATAGNCFGRGRSHLHRQEGSRRLIFDQWRRMMNTLGVVIVGCFVFAGLMGWLGNRR